jgi:hypothetical protein
MKKRPKFRFLVTVDKDGIKKLPSGFSDENSPRRKDTIIHTEWLTSINRGSIKQILQRLQKGLQTNRIHEISLACDKEITGLTSGNLSPDKNCQVSIEQDSSETALITTVTNKAEFGKDLPRLAVIMNAFVQLALKD